MKIEIGPRWGKIDDTWTTVGLYPAPYVDIVADWSDRLPFPDDSADVIYASHVLEHISWEKTVDALIEAWRVLKVCGVLEIHVPDISKIVGAYLGGNCLDDWRHANPEGDFMRWINGRIYAYGNLGNHHRAIFDRPYLTRCLIAAGFIFFRDDAPVRGISAHREIDLAISAVKV